MITGCDFGAMPIVKDLMNACVRRRFSFSYSPDSSVSRLFFSLNIYSFIPNKLLLSPSMIFLLLQGFSLVKIIIHISIRIIFTIMLTSGPDSQCHSAMSVAQISDRKEAHQVVVKPILRLCSPVDIFRESWIHLQRRSSNNSRFFSVFIQISLLSPHYLWSFLF